MDTLLVIEDNLPMQRAIQRVFEAEAFAVQLASDGLAGLDSFRTQLPNAVVLDLNLPGMPGRELCRVFKSSAPAVPVIVVSANAEVDDKVLLLELGADDYVTKPFSPKELVARVRRAMRRAVQMPHCSAQIPQSASPLYHFADVSVNVESMEVKRGGQRVSLTAQEFRVLRYFIARENRAISRGELLNEAWGYQNYPSTRTVDNHILRLRQKLESDPSSPQHFLTLHRAGYKFVPAAQPERASG